MTNREEIARSGIEEGLQNVREYFAKIKKNCYILSQVLSILLRRGRQTDAFTSKSLFYLSLSLNAVMGYRVHRYIP